jgi:hypothetical protein
MNTWWAEAYQFAHRFLYRHNDANRLLTAARTMTVVWGIALGIVLFSWTYEWLGFKPAIVVLVFYALEPNLFAHSSLVTTDVGVTCFIVAAVYFLWRTCRRFSAMNVTVTAIAMGLASVSKFSSVLLVPVIALLLAIAAVRRDISPRRAMAITAVLGLTTYVAIWAVYGFRYAPGPSGGWMVNIEESHYAERVSGVMSFLTWVDAHRLLPNAYTQGFLLSQTSTAQWPAFLFGEVSLDGWWYYFPVAFLLKSPIALIVLSALGLVLIAGRSRLRNSTTCAFVLVPAAVYLSFAMASGINMGVRHILPIYPFVVMLVGVAACEVFSTPVTVRHLSLAAVIVLLAVEVGRVYPKPLTFFNAFVGGPANGFRYLADSNLAWGGNLVGLKNWMEEQQISHVNLAYFGTADPAYHGINCTFLPGSPTFAQPLIARPRLPGYVAISGTVLSGVYLPPHWRLFYRPFWTMEPVAIVGNTTRIYWVDTWPEDDASRGQRQSDADIDSHRLLADALLFGMQWPDQAAVHYRAYLTRAPGDVTLLTRYGVALAESGRLQDSIEIFTRVTQLAPGDQVARRNLDEANRRVQLATLAPR